LFVPRSSPSSLLSALPDPEAPPARIAPFVEDGDRRTPVRGGLKVVLPAVLNLHVGEDDAVGQLDLTVGLVAPQRDPDLAGVVLDADVPDLPFRAVVAVERALRIRLDDAPPTSTVSPISSSAMSVVSGTYSTSSSTRSTVPRSPT